MNFKPEVIKPEALLQEMENPNRKQRNRSGLTMLFKRAWVSAVISILLFFIFVYLHQGTFFFNLDGSSVFNRVTIVELVSMFLYLFIIFWLFKRISFFINLGSGANWHPWIRRILEAVMVIASSVSLLYLTIDIPFGIIFPEIEPTPGRPRAVYVVGTIFALFFYYFVERERSRKLLQEEMLLTAGLQKENFEAQLQSLQNQVNPHFLFNSLNVLGSLIYRDEEQARSFVRRLSRVYSSFLENSHKQHISLKNEMRLTRAYIYLLSIRFGNNVRFETEVSEEQLDLNVPPGAVQMLVENAVKHNGSTKKKPLVIKIFTKEESIIVQNNLQPRKEEVKSTRKGLKNIMSRYRYLTEKEVTIHRTENEFTVVIPLLRIQEHESGAD